MTSKKDKVEYNTPITFVCGQRFTIERWSDAKKFILISTGSHLVKALYIPECITGCNEQEIFNMDKITPMEVLNLFGKGEYDYCTLKLDGELLTKT